MAFETNIAKVSWTREDSSDATKTYNRMTLAQLQKLAPGFDWRNYLEARAPTSTSCSSRSRAHSRASPRSPARRRCRCSKDQLIVYSLDAYADVPAEGGHRREFRLLQHQTQRTPQNQPRWKRAVDFTTNILTDDVSKVYVAKWFPPESKAAMQEAGRQHHRRDGTADRKSQLDGARDQGQGQGQARRLHAAHRLSRPVARLYVRRPPDDLFGNAMRANQWGHDWNIGKLGKPVMRWEWGLDPMTVNAQANFSLVAITFPAAVLQPPFFDPNADPAVNYGGIGSVIGHEMSHHFDDQGSKYDAQGNLVDWWTPQDVASFKRLSEELVKQYDAYEVFPGAHVKGEFTLGENIGDLAGASALTTRITRRSAARSRR